MSKEIKLAVATFPAFAWNPGLAEDLRGDLLELQLNRELAGLGGKIIQQDGQLKLVRAADETADLYDATNQRVDLEGLYGRVKAAPSFKGLTAEGAPRPPQSQPGELPEPTTTNPAMRKASRESRNALADFQRGQQETAEQDQRRAESSRQPAPVFTGKYEPVNRAQEALKRAAADSLAAFQAGQQE